MTVPVVSAAQAAARDAAAIAAGIPSRALMQRAGAAAAAILARRWPRHLRRGVAVYAGAGNNGGDAWVVAASLAAAGIRVHVAEVLDARTPDAIAERAHARPLLPDLGPDGREGIVVDGLLGTGARGAPHGDIAAAITRIAAARAAGARVVALDVPSGLDATTGAREGAVRADLTVTFGTMKRGLLVGRGHAGAIRVVDIGLGTHAAPADGAPHLVDAHWALARVPAIAAGAHKGSRGRLLVVGGAAGMAGAVVLAARAALRTGAGLVQCVVAPESVQTVQALVPAALATAWPADEASLAALAGWATGILAGPGLGRSDEGARLVRQLLAASRVPVVLDADALNTFAGDAAALAPLLDGRAALLTPHPAEFARLAGGTADTVDRDRWDAIAPLARTVRAGVLLKGVPTVLGDARGARWVSASGNPALATGGSGDILGGIAATLVMQRGEALESGAVAAWVHGHAAELAAAPYEGATRGVTLDDVMDALPAAFVPALRGPAYPVLAALPAVREGA